MSENATLIRPVNDIIKQLHEILADMEVPTADALEACIAELDLELDARRASTNVSPVLDAIKASHKSVLDVGEQQNFHLNRIADALERLVSVFDSGALQVRSI